jgi:hypothetical protein
MTSTVRTLAALSQSYGIEELSVLLRAGAVEHIRAKTGIELSPTEARELFETLVFLRSGNQGLVALRRLLSGINPEQRPAAAGSTGFADVRAWAPPQEVIVMTVEPIVGMPKETAAVIERAHRASMPGDGDQILRDFVELNVGRLSVQDALDLIGAVRQGSNNERWILYRFVDTNASRCSADDALALARVASGAEALDRVLGTIARATAGSLSLGDALRMIRAATWQDTEEVIGLAYLAGHPDATAAQADRLAGACQPNSRRAIEREFGNMIARRAEKSRRPPR